MRSRAFLASSSPVRMQQVLGAAITSALGVLAGCSSQPVACGGCNCGDVGSPTPFDITYDVCEPGDGGPPGDAETDASPTDAGMCFASCDQACAVLKPATIAGTGAICLSSTQDGGSTGTVTAHCEVPAGMCMGRKLDGLAAPEVDCGDSLGAFFARSAWLEAASVGAFRRLARELRAHGAPERLVAAAKASARDEIRHARLMARLAKKHGARVPRVVIERMGNRDLESIARENAIEGCVGETFGAALAVWQSEHEKNGDIRDAMRAIAADAAWAETRLPPDARARVRTARIAAGSELSLELRDPHERAFAAEMHRELWAA
jgi:hypothetical protein